MNRDEVRAHLTGPFPSISTPFNEDGSVDYDGLRNQIDFNIAAGSKTVLLTVGDSHYTCLSEAEIAQITRVACEQTAGRVMVVAADRWHSTERSIEFAQFAKGAGADVLMVLPPNWASSCTTETFAEHYAAVSRHIPVMLVTGVFMPHGADFALKAIEKTLDDSDNVVAITDDMCRDFARRLCLLAHERVAVFAGGQKVNHMNMWPYGCDGYMSTYMSLKPKIAHDYWRAIQTTDLQTARAIIRDYDMPLFDYLMKLTGCFESREAGRLECRVAWHT